MKQREEGKFDATGEGATNAKQRPWLWKDPGLTRQPSENPPAIMMA